jgi:hypothetical protein
MAKKWEKPPLSFTIGSSIRGAKLHRDLEASFELSRIASSKTTPAKKELFSKILKNSNYFNNEQIDKISDILSKRDEQTGLELHKMLYSTKNNEVLKTIIKRKFLPFKPRKVEWMLRNNYNNVAKAFVNELHKSDFFMNQIENALKPSQQPSQSSQPLQATAQEQPQSNTAGKKPKTKPATGKNIVYKIKNYGTVYGGVGRSVGGGSYAFGGEAQQAAGQVDYKKMMESVLAYNKNIADHLKLLKQEIGKPVEKTKGGFEFVSSKTGKQVEKPAGQVEKTREPEQLELDLKEKSVEGQLELPFNKLNDLIKQATENPGKLKDLYNLNSDTAKKEFDRIVFENKQITDEFQSEALKILLKNRDFDRLTKAVKSENWGILKLEALTRIGSVINNQNKDSAIKLFSSMLKEESEEYYFRVHQSLDRIKDKKLREEIFERLKPDLASVENLMKAKSRSERERLNKEENSVLNENDLNNFFKPPESAVESKKPAVEPALRNLSDYEAVRKELTQFIKNSKKERET